MPLRATVRPRLVSATSAPAASSSVDERADEIGAASRSARFRRRRSPPPWHRCRSRCGPAARNARRACRLLDAVDHDASRCPGRISARPWRIRHWPRSSISGSRAALAITLRPSASVGGHQRVLRRSDRDEREFDGGALQPARRAGDHIAVRQFDRGAQRLQALRCKSTGRAPMAQPPGSDTLA